MCNVTATDGTKAVLYLRWRHGDPWEGSVVIGFHDGDGVSVANPNIVGFQRWSVEGDWHRVDMGYWRDDQLEEAKAALIAVWEDQWRDRE